MIPGLPKRNVDILSDWLLYELQTARSDRAGLENDWIRYAKLYRAKPEELIREFPFRGAANLEIPVAATDIDTTTAGLLGVLFGAPNLWSCEGLKPEMLDFAPRLEEFLEWAQETELKMYGTTVDWVNELVKLGTGVLKQRYRREQKRMFEWRETPQGILQQMVTRIAVDHPDVQRVPLANWYAPATALGVQESPWIGERLELTWTQLENRVRAGIYQSSFLDQIGAHWRAQQPTTQYGRYQTAQEQLDNFLPSHRDKFEVFEFWTDYDIDGDGEPEALVCTLHEPSRAYARIDYNPFFHQEKPYSIARFIRQEGRIYGIGLCEILEMAQAEVSTMHCQRIDNGTIRNSVLFKARRNAGIKADEPVWPGRIFLMDNPTEDMIPMPMGYEAQSTLQEEEMLINYYRGRTGISDYQRGGAGSPAISYSTATTTVQMLQQGRLRLDQTLREIQSALAETGQRVVELYQQFSQGQKPYLVMGDKDGTVVEQILSFPLDTIRLGVAIKVTATNAQLNKETRIRTDQIIFGLVTQFYQQLFQGMAIVVNQQYPPPLRILAAQMVQGGIILARRILDAYGQQDLDRIIPDMEQLNATTQGLSQLGFGQPPVAIVGPGGAGLDQRPGSPSGVPALPAGVSGLYGSGVQAAPTFQGP